MDSLLNELKKHPQEDTARLNLLYNISTAYQSINPGEGIVKSNEGIRLAVKLKNELELGKFISSKGNNYMNEGQYDSALQLLKTALQIFEKQDYEHGVFSALNSIGIIQFYTADYASALSTYSKNLHVAESIKDTGQILAAISNVSVLYRAISNYPEALTYDLKAINLAEKSNNKMGLTNVYYEAGSTYRELKETDKAHEYYQKALNNCIQTGNKRDEATLLSALGQISADKKDYQQALSYYQQAISVGNGAGNVQTEAATLGNIGDIYKKISNYPNAIDYYKKALSLSQKLGDKNTTAYLLGEIGDTYIRTSQFLSSQSSITFKEQPKQALSYLQQSLALAKEIGSLDRQARALDYLSNLYEKQKNYQKALELRKEAVQMDDSINNDDKKQQITRLEMQYAFNKIQDSIKAVTDKQQALAHAETQRQKVINNSLLAGTGFIAIAGFASFLFYKRNRDIKTQRNEAVLKVQVAETEMKALRAQMNPHFIFNSLNSINDYIDKHDTETATIFTTKFAKLMRRILENSEYKEILLSNELQTLELYMQLEGMRLQNGFSYEIKTDEDIDKENTLIPPSLLQPFLENSILHGIAKKQGGKIMLHIQKKGDMLNCVVEDNGIGIQPHAGIKEKQPERKSFGTKITQDRINIINRLKKTNGKVELHNLIQGTRAEVTLPFETAY